MSTLQQATGTGRTLHDAVKDAVEKLQSSNPEFIEVKLIDIRYLAGDDPQSRIPQGEEGYLVTVQPVE